MDALHWQSFPHFGKLLEMMHHLYGDLSTVRHSRVKSAVAQLLLFCCCCVCISDASRHHIHTGTLLLLLCQVI